MIQVDNINGKMIVLKGVGKLFYQEGFPISMAIDECKKKGWVVSPLHVADELLKHGWSSKTAINKLKGEMDLDITGEMKLMDWQLIERFCHSDYEAQREMIFNYLFRSTSEAKTFFNSPVYA